MSFDMTEKLIHSIGLDDDNTEMMIEIDIKNESIKEMKEEKEEMIERKKEREERGVAVTECQEGTDDGIKVLDPFHTQDQG